MVLVDSVPNSANLYNISISSTRIPVRFGRRRSVQVRLSEPALQGHLSGNPVCLDPKRGMPSLSALSALSAREQRSAEFRHRLSSVVGSRARSRNRIIPVRLCDQRIRSPLLSAHERIAICTGDQLGDALLHNSDRGRVFVWSRFPSSDHLTRGHPQLRHRV